MCGKACVEMENRRWKRMFPDMVWKGMCWEGMLDGIDKEGKGGH